GAGDGDTRSCKSPDKLRFARKALPGLVFAGSDRGLESPVDSLVLSPTLRCIRSLHNLILQESTEDKQVASGDAVQPAQFQGVKTGLIMTAFSSVCWPVFRMCCC